MRIRLLTKSKSNNYTESCMINEADGWRGKKVVGIYKGIGGAGKVRKRCLEP